MIHQLCYDDYSILEMVMILKVSFKNDVIWRLSR